VSRLVVFGASGGTGRALVGLALADGITVRAFVRDPAKMQWSHPALEIFRGDVLDAEAVEKAVAGADTVVSLLGLHGAPKDDTTVSAGTRNIVAAMERLAVRRIVSQSCFGVGDSLRQARWLFRWSVYPWLRGHYVDREEQERAVTRSGLDWTIVRPTHLVDRSASGRIGVVRGRTRLYDAVSRIDVARQLLAIIPDPGTYRQAFTLGAA
jgi:uncharacterized protein YbjT (DUF2867 family)